MVDRGDFITVVCGDGGHKFEKQIGWLQEVHTFPCPVCGVRLEVDLNKLDEFVLEQGQDRLAYLRLDIFRG